MNKNDIILIVMLLIISSFIYLIYYLNEDNGNTALVYYENDIVLTIDLNVNNNYVVDGYNGLVYIEVNNKQIRVTEETSLYNLCSKQGYINNSNEKIICLPNKVVIEISGDLIDTEVY